MDAILPLSVIALMLAGLVLLGKSVTWLEQSRHRKNLRTHARIDIVEDDGNCEEGWAQWYPHMGMWKVYCNHKILSCWGSDDGTFPNGNPWGWVRFGFSDRAHAEKLKGTKN